MTSMVPRSHTIRQLIWWTILLTMAMEGLICLMRFGFGLESTRDTASTIGRLTFGIRIHHGYIGLLMMPVAIALFQRSPVIARYLLVIGAALILSDLVHHFVVLWPLTGSPHFDLWYSASK